MSRRVSTRALVAHHVRSHAGGGALVALLVVVLAVLAAGAPVALSALGDATLRNRLDAVPPTVRDVVSENVSASAFPQIGSEPHLDPATTEEIWGSFSASVEDIRSAADSISLRSAFTSVSCRPSRNSSTCSMSAR